MQLFGNRVLITGGGRGIGRATAISLARAGGEILLTYHADQSAAMGAVEELQVLGAQGHARRCDMNSTADINQLVAAAMETLGGIDVLVCNAGMHYRHPLLDISEQEWDEVLNIDLKGPFLLAQQVAKHMVSQGSGGRIVMIDSISADVAYPNLVHYQAAKAGVRMLARGMALELAPYQITVNTVAPGVVATDLNADTRRDPVQHDLRLGRIPLGRFGQPEDIAAAVTFIASNQTDWMTGSTITVDGGQTIL